MSGRLLRHRSVLLLRERRARSKFRDPWPQHPFPGGQPFMARSDRPAIGAASEVSATTIVEQPDNGDRL
jgi:hypothetical protein